jgi:hypothetical protein
MKEDEIGLMIVVRKEREEEELRHGTKEIRK